MKPTKTYILLRAECEESQTIKDSVEVSFNIMFGQAGKGGIVK